QITILIFIHFDSIIPNARDSATVFVDDVQLNDFFVNDLDPGQSVPQRGLRIFSGSMSAEVHPILGEEANTPGKFDVPTPIAHMVNVNVRNADARILYQGKRFNVQIASAQLEAMNGSWNHLGLKNKITGSVVLDGQTVTLGPNDPLDP